jgi:hypothetical protein
LHINEFEILGPQCPTHYSPAGNGDVLNVVVHKNIHLSEVVDSDILDSNHLLIVFHLLYHVRTRDISDSVYKFTDLEWFQSLASELISPRIQISLGEEADKLAIDFSAFIALVYRLSASKLTLWP